MSQGWIAVDLDGTLAHYTEWLGIEHIGAPIPKMVERVKQWLEEGKDVRIFTARIAADLNGHAEKHIKHWCVLHLGVELLVTCKKDFGMIELWDDRCVQVRTNTGEPVQ